METFRNCIVTSFERAETWDQAIKEAFDSGYVKYINGQLELCPETGREHLQAYVELSKTSRYSIVRKIFDDPTIHVEVVHKDNGASSYCLKEETRVEGPVEYGTKKYSKHGGDHKSATFGDLRKASRDQIRLMTPYQGI